MQVTARLCDLTTEALQRRLAHAERSLHCFGLREEDRAFIATLKQAIEAILQQRTIQAGL